MKEREQRRKSARDFLAAAEMRARQKWANATQESFEECLNTCWAESKTAREELLASARAVVLLGQALEVIRDDLTEEEREDVVNALDFQRIELVGAARDFADYEFLILGMVGVKSELFPEKSRR